MVMSSKFNLDNCERMLYKHRIQLVANSILDDLGTNRLNVYTMLEAQYGMRSNNDNEY